MGIQAMQDAVAALLGNLPPYEFDAQMTTTGDKLAALMLQLQMTGYLLRNAEYVMKLRQILNIKSRSAVRAALPALPTGCAPSLSSAQWRVNKKP